MLCPVKTKKGVLENARMWSAAAFWISTTAILFLLLVVVRIPRRRPRVTFLDRATMLHMIATDASARAFFRRMNRQDLIARGAASCADYLHAYVAGISRFDAEERRRLMELASQVDAKTVSFAALHGISWRFAKTNDSVERGMPHTLSDTIFVSNVHRLNAVTLLHEKLHVFQRRHPDATARLVNRRWGFTAAVPHRQAALARNNPDTDGAWHAWPGGILVVGRFDTERPSDLTRASAVASAGDGRWRTLRPQDLDAPAYVARQLEHPWELMAEIVSRMLMQGSVTATTALERHALDWLAQERSC